MMAERIIKKLKIDNFKSLFATEIVLDKHVFLIGLNGVGKTTILQAIDFLSAITKENAVKNWLSRRGWKSQDLLSQYSKKKLIDYEIELQLDQKHFTWEFSFNTSLLRCTKERIKINNSAIFEVKDGYYFLNEGNRRKEKNRIDVDYTGTILSILKKDILGKELNDFVNFFREIKSADLLSPILMKKRARESGGDIGLGGEKLSAYISELQEDAKTKLNNELKKFFENVDSVKVKTLQAGWKELRVIEKFNNSYFDFSGMHISDGLLRIIAILAQIKNNGTVFLFDEIEDGINQELINVLIDMLIETDKQIVATTHSPLLLNFLTDEKAKNSIFFVYKSCDGFTRVKNFFEVLQKYSDSITQKDMENYGPGELMLRVDLVELTKKLAKEQKVFCDNCD